MKNTFIKPFIIISIIYLVFFAFQPIIFSKKLADGVDYAYPSSYIDIKPTSQKADVTINFRFIQHGWHGNHDNLFQTSKENKGIRLEMGREEGKPGKWALVFYNEQKTYDVAFLGTIPKMGEWHTFKAVIKGKKIKVWVDSKLKFDRTLKNMSYRLNDIALGTGMSKSRPFNGEIKDFTLSISYKHEFLKYLNFIVLQLLLAGFLLLIIKKPSKIKETVSSLSISAFCILLAIITLNRIWPLSAFSVEHFLYWEFAAIVLFFFYFIRKKFALKFLPCIILCSIFFIYLNTYFFPLSFLTSWGYFFITTAFGFLVSAAISASKSHKLKVIIGSVSAVFVFIVFLCSSFGALYLYKVGSSVMRMDEMSAFFQSNSRESLEFLLSFFSPFEILLFFAAAFLATYVFTVFVRDAVKTEKPLLYKLSGILFMAGLLFIFFSNPEESFYYNFITAKNNYAKVTQEFKKYKELRTSIGSIEAEKETKGELYFLIIGEASNPRHWSAYVYFRDTTPWALKERTENPNSLFFNRVYSSHVHTVPSLIKALTAANQYNQELDFASPSIIEVAKAAGFKVHWISNQDKISLVDNPLTVMAEEADTTLFTNVSRFGTDEALIPLVEKTLSSIDTEENNLILIHIMGSHAKYEKRLPPDFRTEFPSTEEFIGNNARKDAFVKNVLNPYDNTILFSDKILKTLYEKFSGMPNPVKLFLFFSDHGEDVYGEKFHNSSIFTYEMARIPLFMIFSEEYKNKNEEKIRLLESRTDSVFTLDLLFNLMNSLLGINTGLNDRKYDFSSKEYSISMENALTLYADDTLQENLYTRTQVLKISDDPIFIKKRNLEILSRKYPGICFAAIHTDAIGAALQALSEGFDSFEINVTAPSFLIGHAPQMIYDISLEEFLSAMPLDRVKRIWIDLKELKKEDIDAVIAKLEVLDEKFGIKKKFLIETYLIDPDVKKFTEAGWDYSYYLYAAADKELRELLVKENPSDEETRELRGLAEKQALNIKQQEASSISFFGYTYPFVKKYLEPLLGKNITYNVFAIPGMPSINDKDMAEKLYENKIINDSRTKIILLPPETFFTISL